jgi:hypothetical protein
VDAQLGRHDQRPDDAERRLGQDPHRSDHPHVRDEPGLLRHEHLRRPDDVVKAVNSLSHYTDWTIGHVHSGALGWNGMVTFGALYYLTPRLWNRERLYSLRMVNWHFWLATTGIVFYAASMWVAGITRA